MKISFASLFGVVVVTACTPSLPQMPPVLPGAPVGGGKCSVAASQSSPLVTEWPAPEKANLEVLLRTGAVAVAYSGCSMRLLPECRVRGVYRWLRTTPARDVLEINNEDELYAKLPLGAASLEGELKRAGNLAVETVVAGQLKLDGASVAEVPAEGECARATHLMTSLSVGAFSLSAGGSVSGKASATVAAYGEAGGGASRAARLLRGAGDPAACGQSTDESPHGNCASPVQVFLTPLPGRGADEGPPDMVKVELVSGNPAARWDVYSDDQVICTTPCSRWLHPARPLMLRARDEAFMRAPDRIEVPNLLQSPERHVMLAAHPTAQGKLATGLAFTTFAGMAVVAGAALTAVGFATDHSGMRTGGMITLGLGLPALAGSIWLITDAMPRAEVVPYRAYPARPGVVAGSF